MARKVAVIPGDGIGPEVVDSALRVLDSLGLDLEYVVVDAGMDRWRREGVPIAEEDIDMIGECDALLKGPISTPVGRGGYRSVNVLLRRRFGLYANIRFFRSNPHSLHRDFDIVFFRENTEGLYSGAEMRPSRGVAIGLRIITEDGSLRLLRRAFEYARRTGRRRVTVVHKANIFRETCGLFLESARRIAGEYPDIEVEYGIVDSTAYRLVREPGRFDVIATTNMFGDILTDVLAGVVGSIGLVPSVNLGDGFAMFEAIHGAAPDIAGRGVANPIGLVLSAAEMLDYLGYGDGAEAVRRAVDKVLTQKGFLTPDLGGCGTTELLTRGIILALEG